MALPLSIFAQDSDDGFSLRSFESFGNTSLDQHIEDTFSYDTVVGSVLTNELGEDQRFVFPSVDINKRLSERDRSLGALFDLLRDLDKNNRPILIDIYPIPTPQEQLSNLLLAMVDALQESQRKSYDNIQGQLSKLLEKVNTLLLDKEND